MFEFKEFVWIWPKENRLECRIAGGNPNASIPDALQAFWADEQYNIMSSLNQEIADGWEPITEVGPSAIKYNDFTKSISIIDCSRVLGWVLSLGLLFITDAFSGFARKEIWCEPLSVRIQLKRSRN